MELVAQETGVVQRLRFEYRQVVRTYRPNAA